MKRIAIFLCVAALVPMASLAQTSAPAKAAAKKPAATAAEPSKPKPRPLTRDQLRKCYDLGDEIAAGEAQLKALRLGFEEERAVVLRDQADLKQRIEARNAAATAIKNEQAALVALGESLKKPDEKLDRAALEAMFKDYNARFDANGKLIDEYNAGKAPLIELQTKLEPRIDASNAKMKELNAKIEDHNLALEEKRAECDNKLVLDTDEAAVIKERAAAKKP
jgi:DNA repair exonuclease SbcCD ATPase subunit